MKKVMCFLCALISVSLSFAILAVEPLRDRARVIGLQADLLLPQGGVLKVNMETDCGSPYENLGVLAMSDQGARIIAAGLEVLYGAQVGQDALRQWKQKANPLDPRKPTFLLVQEAKHDAQPKGNHSGEKPGVIVTNACGTYNHLFKPAPVDS